MELSALSALSTQSASPQSSTGIADNFDTFLTLLTTQLQNQDPLEPLDTNEFTAQLVQFAGVEQSIQTNDQLNRLLALQTASALTGVVGYIGQTVTASGTSTQLDNGAATWQLDAAADAQAEVTIRNAAGQVVQTTNINLTQGANSYSWDGRTSSGSAAPEGTYSIAVDATGENGNNVDVSTLVEGVVTAVDFTGPDPLLTVGETQVRLAEVQAISQTRP